MKLTNTHRLALAVVAGVLVVFNLSAQVEPIRNWAAPLYWQASDRESGLMKRVGESLRVVQDQSSVVEAAASATPPLVFVAMTPCRMVDTRGYDPTFTGVYGPPMLTANSTRTLPVAGVEAGHCSVPAEAQAVSINVTLVPVGTPVQWLTIWPAGQTQPVVSTLNDYQGVIVNNAAVAPLGIGGAFNAYVTDATHLFVDVNGYYLPPSALALGAGTGGAPALTVGDTTTGLYSTGAGTVSIATSGAERVRVNSTGLSVTGNLDFSNAITQGGQALLRSSANSLFLGLGALGSLTESNNSAFGAGALASITSGGGGNTGIGHGAGNAITSGYDNVAVGDWALPYTTTGVFNTAIGPLALHSNSTGDYNIALGSSALYNTLGDRNIGVGYYSGYNLTTGYFNIDIGNMGVAGESATIRIGESNQTRTFISGIRGVTTGSSDAYPVVIDSNGQLGTVNSSLRSDSDSIYLGFGALGSLTASNNSAYGAGALASVTSGAANTGVGFAAGHAITSSFYNVAVGQSALTGTTSGGSNTAIGATALVANTTGGNNTALGYGALNHNTLGYSNIAVGLNAGDNLTTGNYNIDIGNDGVAGESATTRLGNSLQTRTFVSGIRGVTTGSADGYPVLIDSNGQLGTVSTSLRSDVSSIYLGWHALGSMTPGYNAAFGPWALESVTSGSANTVAGYGAGSSITSGGGNVAVGRSALTSATSGGNNTAVGANAGDSLTTGSYNIDIGNEGVAGESATTRIGDSNQTRAFISGIRGVTTGSDDAYPVLIDSNGQLGTVNSSLRSSSDSLYLGSGALGSLTAGYNSAFGAGALASVTSGAYNTVAGHGAGNGITSGGSNVAVGELALNHTTSGSNNTAIGFWALRSNSGDNNTALGFNAGTSVTTGSNNIDIGNQGVIGESATTRIGDSGIQTRTFISSIRGVTTGSANAVAVVIDSNGQLGTVSSSRTVKRDIEDMGDTTGAIMGLRPVRFRYKVHGPDSPEQYGLVAEEVAEVAPDLVARNQNGEIETVYYDKVNAMLLNQVQTQQRVIEKLESRLAELESRVK